MEMMEFDASRYLRDEKECRLYLAEVMDGGTSAEIQKAIADVVRATKADIDKTVQEQLGSGTADFATILVVLGVLDLKLTVKKAKK